MSYRDTYSLYPRAHSYSAANEQRVGSYMRTLMSYGASPSSMLNTVPTYRSRILADIACTSTPDVNEVYPHLYVGDAVAAKDKSFLRRMGINYVLNTAEGKRYTQVDTDHLYYRDCPGLRYKGFQLMDLPTTDISKYFHIAANFIDEGISRGAEKLFSGYMPKLREALLLSIPEMQSSMTATLHLHAAVCRVLVHCLMGVSRSATCAIAFLMIKRGMSLTEALALVRSRRDIHPNEGFLRQLQQLDKELRVCRIR